MRAVLLVAAVGALAAAAAAATRTYQLAQPGNEYDPAGGGIADSASTAARDFAYWVEQNAQEVFTNTQPMPDPIYLPTQLAAMRETVKQAEGTAREGDPYRVCYGYRHTIASFADHPAVTGEWRGETLPDAMCTAAGFGPGCVSTAAGAYQIVKPTWLRLKKKLNLPDFSPASQDAACDELLLERGAADALARGDFAGAVAAASREWASLPGNYAKQGQRSIAWLSDKFAAAGGATA